MDKVEEARAALEALLQSLVGTQAEVMEAADAYGAARGLKAHVDACREWKAIEPGLEPERVTATRPSGLKCGDGWYCDEAKKYIKGTD